MGDETAVWTVEQYTVAPYKAAQYVAVTAEQAVELVTHALAVGNIGGIVIYRTPGVVQHFEKRKDQNVA